MAEAVTPASSSVQLGPGQRVSVGTGWTDGVGHLGTIVGTSLLVGRLFAWTAGHGYYGWILYVTLAGAIFPSLILAKWGMNQKSGVLEELSM